LLAEAGVDAVASALVSTPAELPGALADMTLPVVVKPRRGAGSVDTVRIDTMEEAERWATRQAERIRTEPGAVREFVAEEMLMGDTGCAGADFGDYVSVESVIEGASVRHVSVNGKFPLTEPFRECGQVLPSTVPPEVQQRCRDLAEGAIRALGIDIGITHTEMKLTPTGPRIIEVNGRLGGYCAELIGRSTGFSMVGAAVRMALGLPVGDLPDLPEHITYQFFFQPPQNAVRLVTRAEPDAVAGISHVSRFEPYLQPGAELDWHRGTPAMSGVLFGEAPDHHAVLAAVEAAGEALKITYE
jgi:biotin carboxylase